MPRVRFIIQAALVLVTSLACASLTQAASNFVFVASGATDSGACLRASPCKTITYALTQVLAKGEVTILDTSVHAPFTVNKSVTIVAAPGARVVVSSPAASSTAITVTIGAADAVILRGLTVTGLGTGAHGIRFTGAGTLQIEECAVSRFTTHGIFQSGSGKMYVKDTEVRNSQYYGIRMYVNSGSITGSIDHCRIENITKPSTDSSKGVLIGNNARVSVSNTVSSGNVGFGFMAGGSGRMVISDSTAEGNSAGGVGFYVTEGGHMTVTHCRSAENSGGFAAYAAGVMTIDSSVAAENQNSGIVSDGNGTVVRVANTTVVNNGRYGFFQYSAASFISRGNNNVYGNVAGPTEGTITLDTSLQ
jgi:Right handed beta helix region